MPWTALSHWSLEPVPVLGSVAAALLYWYGRTHATATLGRPKGWDMGDVSFAVGLGVLLIALTAPIASFDTQLQWDHMLQHVILLVVAPPLILLSDPFRTAWAGIEAARGRSASTPLTSSGPPARWLHRGAVPAVVVFFAFGVNLLVWHVPSVYDVTLRVDWVHDLEHTLFFGLGLLFWDQVLGPFDIQARLSLGGRALLVIAGMLLSWALAVLIGYASHPLYAYPSQPGGMNPLADQEIAAGIMWVPGGIPFLIALIYFGCVWFERDDRAARANLPMELEVE